MRFWKRFKIVFNRFLVAVAFEWPNRFLYDGLARTVLAMMDLNLCSKLMSVFKLPVKRWWIYLFQPPRRYQCHRFPGPKVVVIHG